LSAALATKTAIDERARARWSCMTTASKDKPIRFAVWRPVGWLDEWQFTAGLLELVGLAAFNRTLNGCPHLPRLCGVILRNQPQGR
jgi:hypothetical protein